MKLSYPAIETIEIVRSKRRLGYGRYFLSEIENYFRGKGFEGLGYSSATKERASFIESPGYEPLSRPIGDFVEEWYRSLI
jgi:hypothetical protein